MRARCSPQTINTFDSLDQQVCGGKMTKSQGEIKTPNWPDKKYPPGTSCSWLVTVEPDRVSLPSAAVFTSNDPLKKVFSASLWVPGHTGDI